ncbi:MAG TPA: type I-A CRISPR-associated protein Cas4/Csa1 [Chloroflexota bacterium]|nr:type I-A CRISPR-associated protein Cas4/Csa1 [Chloroflexota bacterium]
MYFPSEEERRYLSRGLLPEARRQGIEESLRGWNWDRPPLRPVYEAPLGVHEIADKYCASSRAVYLQRVRRTRARPTLALVEGRLLHQVVARLITEAKRLVYVHGAACLPWLERLRLQPHPSLEDVALTEEEKARLRERMDLLRAYEARRLVERVEDALARQPYAGPDALVAVALPVSVEVRLSGWYLGLSKHLAVDAISFAEMVVYDAKFGPREEFHRLATTGYALVLESLYEVPVDIGCVVYGDFRNGQVVIERDYHIVGNELRQWFLEEREERMRLVAEELDPGLPRECPLTCPYLRECRPAGSVAPGALGRSLAANLAVLGEPAVPREA